MDSEELLDMIVSGYPKDVGHDDSDQLILARLWLWL